HVPVKFAKESAFTPADCFSRTRSRSPKFFLRPSAPETESGLGFYVLAVHLKQRIDEKINRSAFRFRIDQQIATLGQFKAISRIMTKIIISEFRVLPRFTDIHRHPLTVRQKFGPAMVALDFAFILVEIGRASCRERVYIESV